ncbi:hypothetical protein JCM19233_4669 [Vibrio astriarenae]|nr:hypothetical protein JCM19233_4669 [Vibrio sp. C7]
MNKLFSLLHRHPYIIALLIAVTTAYSAWYGQRHFEVNADLSSLVKQEGEWVDNLERINQTFPDTGNVLVLVSSDSAQSAEAAKTYTQQLAAEFRQHSVFTDVFAPSTFEWFDEYALGFIDEADFSKLRDEFEYQLGPAIVSARMQSLEQYFALLAENGQNLQSPLNPILEAATGEQVAWETRLSDVVSVPRNYVVTLTAEPDNSEKNPNQQVITKVEQVLASVERPKGVSVEYTGKLRWIMTKSKMRMTALRWQVVLHYLVCCSFWRLVFALSE